MSSHFAFKSLKTVKNFKIVIQNVSWLLTRDGRLGDIRTIKQTGKILVFGSVVAYGGSIVVGLNLYEKNVGQFIDHTDIFFNSNTSQCKITNKIQ